VNFDFLIVVVEDVESVLGFSSGSIRFSVLFLPVLPEVINGGGDILSSDLLGVVEHEVSGSSNGGDSEKGK